MLKNTILFDIDPGGGNGESTTLDFASMVGEDGNFTEGSHDTIRTALGEGYEDFKGFDDYANPAALLKGAADTKRAFHAKQEGMVKLPTAESTEDEIKAYREAKGVPESPDAYELTRRKLPEGQSFDEEGTKMIKDWMHEKGYSQAEAQDLMTMYDAYEEQLITRMAEAEVAANKKATDAFAAKHGEDVEKVTRLAGQAMEKTGFTEKVLTHLETKYPGIGNDPKIIDWFHEDIVPKMLPGVLHDGEGGGNGGEKPKGLAGIYTHKDSKEQLTPKG
jgi:hypothetical protein